MQLPNKKQPQCIPDGKSVDRGSDQEIDLVTVFMALARMVDCQSGSMCKDLDSIACQQMKGQNNNFCADPVLSTNICPFTCNLCPLTCYSCNTTYPDISGCHNTMTCSAGEVCQVTRIRDIAGREFYSMACGQSTIQSPDTQFCSSDLCNVPITTTTATTTTSNTTNATTPQVNACKKDIIIMLEDSLSTQQFFGEAKSCLSRVFSKLNIGYDDTRVALGTFARATELRWNLDSSQTANSASLLRAMNEVSRDHIFDPNGRNLAAVEFINSHFYEGDRANVSNVVILVSEGHFHAPLEVFIRPHVIQTLHTHNQDVITVALGSADRAEMLSIATDQSHSFYISDKQHFDSNALEHSLLNLICQ